MEPIHVPPPPPSAFNKNRPPSDLLLSQLKHFQHLEQKHGINLDPAIVRDLHTEAGAARYITAITRSLRSRALVPTAGIALVPSRKSTRRPSPALSLAAAASPTPDPAPTPTSTPTPTPGPLPVTRKSPPAQSKKNKRKHP